MKPSAHRPVTSRRPDSVAQPMRRVLLSLLALLVLATPASALASAGSDQIIGECANEQLSKTYSQADYTQALADLPADLREYTDCAGVIDAAQRAAARGDADTSGASGATGGTTGTGGTSGTDGAASGSTALAADPLASASPEDQAAAKQAQAAGGNALEVGGATITPGDPGSLVSSLDDLPAPILVLLILFVVGGLAGLGYFLKRRVLGSHS